MNEAYLTMRKVIKEKTGQEDDDPVQCIHCGSAHVVRNGWHDGKQAYKCVDCGRTFLQTSSSAIAHSHFGGAVWKQVIRDTVDGVPLDRTAEKLGLSHDTVLNMRHKILDCVGHGGPGGDSRTDGAGAPEDFRRFLNEKMKAACHVSKKYIHQYEALFRTVYEDPEDAVDRIYAMITERNHSYRSIGEMNRRK